MYTIIWRGVDVSDSIAFPFDALWFRPILSQSCHPEASVRGRQPVNRR
jgi:hypothetical protein